MKYKRLGKTEFSVSEMGFGGIPIMSGRESEFLVTLKDVEYKKTLDVIRNAYENGINFFDTAVDYRDSEEKIGIALHDVRKKVYIATKSKALTYEQMHLEVDKSLKSLNVDYIDLYQLHYVKDNDSYNKIIDPKNGAYKALLELQNKGIIRAIGIASHNPFVLEPAIKSGNFATVQLPVNLIEQECLNIINLALEYDMGIIGMKPFAGGTLVTPLPKIEDLELSAYNMKKIALTYILNQNLTTVIPGVSSTDELNENLKIYHEKSAITELEQANINKIRERLGTVFCRRCQYCEPCPKGVEISKILRLIKYYEDYNLPIWAKEQYLNIENKADKCVKCFKCENKCPYKIKIVDELKRIHEVLS